MPNLLKILWVFFLYAFSLHAQDLGVHGHTFGIKEESLLDFLQSKLRMFSVEEIEILEEKLRKHYLNLIEEPRPVAGLDEAKVYEVYYFDPTICAVSNITDQKGKVIISKGTRVNPLSIVCLNNELLFFDGTKESHLDWAKAQSSRAKWVLVRGRPLDLQDMEKRQVYFDQFGALTTKLQIKHVPAKVSQDELKLKIELFPVGELCAGA